MFFFLPRFPQGSPFPVSLICAPCGPFLGPALFPHLCPGCRGTPLSNITLFPAQASPCGISPIDWCNTSSSKITDPVSPTALTELFLTSVLSMYLPRPPLPLSHTFTHLLDIYHSPSSWPLLPPLPWLIYAPMPFSFFLPISLLRLHASPPPPPSH